MLEQFAASFAPVSIDRGASGPWRDPTLTAAAGYEDFAARFAGSTFENGLYRFHDGRSGPRGQDLIADAFPAFAERARPFGFDWLGRQFALDQRRVEGGEQLVLLLEPGTGEALELPFSFAAFHEELADLREDALAVGFFEQWANANPGLLPLRPSDCVGYRVPLFLGGRDTPDNLEVTDMEVYWSITGQLRQGTRGRPTGTSIRSVTID